MVITRFEDIEGWKLGRELSRRIYQVAGRGLFAKDYGLRDQIQRAAGSVMHNIAEGFDGGSNAEFAKFLRYAQRSCSEVQSELYVALDQAYVTKEEFDELYALTQHAHDKIGGFIKYLVQAGTDRPHSKQTARIVSTGTKNMAAPRTQNETPVTKDSAAPKTKNEPSVTKNAEQPNQEQRRP